MSISEEKMSDSSKDTYSFPPDFQYVRNISLVFHICTCTWLGVKAWIALVVVEDIEINQN